MSEWAVRLGLVFPDKARVDFGQFIDEVNTENAEYPSLKKEHDEFQGTKPTYEQISQERILDEANKNIQVLKSFETILQERIQSYGTFFAAQGKYAPSFEIFQYCEGTLRQALDALFVFLEQELQQARQQQTLGDLRKALSEVKVDAQKRLSDYQREVNDAEKEVALAEKKLAKFKEAMEKALDQKRRLDSGEHEREAQSPRRQIAIARYHSNRSDINKQEKIKESLELIAKSDKEIKEGIQNLLRVLGLRDQVLLASRRAYQKLDKDCKKTVALTFRKLIVREREAAAARESVLAKLESAVNNINVDDDFEDFIMQHRQGEDCSLQCCVQALTVLGDLQMQDGHIPEIIFHNKASVPISASTLYSNSITSIFGMSSINPDRETLTISNVEDMAMRNDNYTPFSREMKNPSSVPISSNRETAFYKHKSKESSGDRNDDRDRERERDSRQMTAPTPIALASTASATLSYAVNTGLPIAEAFASIVSLCTGEKKKSVEIEAENEEISSDDISFHLSRIFYSNCCHTNGTREYSLDSKEASRMNLGYTPVDNINIKKSKIVRGNSIISKDDDAEVALCRSNNMGEQIDDETVFKNCFMDNSHMNQKEINRTFSDSSGKFEFGKSNESEMTSEFEMGNNLSIIDVYNKMNIIPINNLDIMIEKNNNDNTIPILDLNISSEYLSEVVKSQRGRDAFIIELNQFRSKKVEVGFGFNILGSILWNVLDRCKESNDIHTAKVIMMLSQTFYRRYSPAELDNDKRSTIVADTIPNVKSGVVLVDILPSDTSNYTVDKSMAEDHAQFIRIMVSHVSKEGSVEGGMVCPPGQCKVEERYTIVGHETAEAHGQGNEGINREIEGNKTRSIAREFEVGGFSDNTEDNTEDSDDEDVDDIESYRLADRSAGRREYLKSTLMTHAIWRDRLFWEQALWQCTMEQLHAIPYEQAWHDLPDEQRLQAVRTVHNVTFSQVMAITHSMMELGCSKSNTIDFLHGMCSLHELSERQRQDLLTHLLSR